jgi:hypothetical protein
VIAAHAEGRLHPMSKLPFHFDFVNKKIFAFLEFNHFYNFLVFYSTKMPICPSPAASFAPATIIALQSGTGFRRRRRQYGGKAILGFESVFQQRPRLRRPSPPALPMGPTPPGSMDIMVGPP